jgi:adenylylsulfate kinase
MIKSPTKILIMGLPGAGKTTIAKLLVTKINAVWINADQIREEYNDWDFSAEGRIKQSLRMRKISDELIEEKKNVVADFICPTPQTRKDFNADHLIWVDTIKESRFDDTNKMFIPPKKYFLRVLTKNSDYWVNQIIEKLNKENN